MKIAFISDIHSNLHAFKSVLDKIDSLNVDEIFCCGDIVGYNAFPKKCLDVVRRRDIVSVMGNHDFAVVHGKTSWFNKFGILGVNYSRKVLSDSDIKFLGKLPFNKQFDREAINFYIAHGSPRDNLFEYIHPWFSDEKLKDMSAEINADIIILGHTHVPMEKKIDKKLFLNPGSVGQPRDGIPESRFMVFDTDTKIPEWFKVSFDIDAACRAIFEKKLPKTLCDRLKSGR